MPRGDGTGPSGQGPMTGRAMGYCAGFNVPGFMNPGFGYGLGMAWRRGMGRGFGRGFRWRARIPIMPQSAVMPQQVVPVINPYAQPTAQIQPVQQLTAKDEKTLLKQDKEAIKQEMEILKQELEEIEKRLKELK